jgi:hypothetical protein
MTRETASGAVLSQQALNVWLVFAADAASLGLRRLAADRWPVLVRDRLVEQRGERCPS